MLLADTVQDQRGAADTADSPQDVGPVLPPPEDLRLRVAAGLTGQVDSLLLPHHEVVRTSPVHDTGRH